MLNTIAVGSPVFSFAALDAERALFGLLVAVGFALAALAVRAVTLSGAAVGVVVAWLLFAAAGPAGFLTLMLVFLLALGSTRLGHARKVLLGTAEDRAGRSGRQVLANLAVAAGGAALNLATGEAVWLVPALAALAEAAADTVSSECGQATRSDVYLITTGERVTPGTDGGVSLPGTLAGVLAAAVVAAAAAAMGMLPWAWSGIAAAAAMLGMTADSFLGALLELRGRLSNEAVNFLSTLVAALLAWLLL